MIRTLDAYKEHNGFWDHLVHPLRNLSGNDEKLFGYLEKHMEDEYVSKRNHLMLTHEVAPNLKSNQITWNLRQTDPRKP